MTDLIAIAGMQIRTDYWPKPVPSAAFDWGAIDDATYDGEGCRVGRGSTEAEAIADLIAESNEDWPHPAWTWRYHLRRLEVMED